ncbi:FUSC family protein [Deinococcus aetherius]|uniref:hypothetical protein n=1 Tax=Deinococcus aetherius TaxID=200252 RepID=UPI00222F32F6|nr:hypothetical protein [Deinococcus aetherius]
MFSLTASGVPEHAVGGERVPATLLGGGLALAVSRLGPAWQSRQVAGALRAAAQAQVEYPGLLASPSRRPSPGELDASRARARASRVQAEGVVRAAALEPRWDPGARAAAEESLARLEANAAALHAQHAQALRAPPESARRLHPGDRGPGPRRCPRSCGPLGGGSGEGHLPGENLPVLTEG